MTKTQNDIKQLAGISKRALAFQTSKAWLRKLFCLHYISSLLISDFSPHKKIFLQTRLLQSILSGCVKKYSRPKKESFVWYVRKKFSDKLTVSLIMFASFLENFAYVLNEWSQKRISILQLFMIYFYTGFNNMKLNLIVRLAWTNHFVDNYKSFHSFYSYENQHDRPQPYLQFSNSPLCSESKYSLQKFS